MNLILQTQSLKNGGACDVQLKRTSEKHYQFDNNSWEVDLNEKHTDNANVCYHATMQFQYRYAKFT